MPNYAKLCTCYTILAEPMGYSRAMAPATRLLLALMMLCSGCNLCRVPEPSDYTRSHLHADPPMAWSSAQELAVVTIA